MSKREFRSAVGLSYEPGTMEAPLVGVKAEADLADTVVAIARRFGVPVIENEELARVLNDVPLDEQIPTELYHAVAVLLRSIEQLAASTKAAPSTVRRGM